MKVPKTIPSARIALAFGIFICTAIAAYSLWYASAGLFPNFPAVDNAYLDLGESFLHGQIALLEKPDPRLIHLPNPYDPAQRDMPYPWDASYYQGKFYLYWGPVPALAFAAVEGIAHVRPAGSLPVLFCYVVLPFILLAIFFRIWRRTSAPAFSPGLFVLLSFINLPFLFLLGRPVVYETSILAGQFFLLLGLLCWMNYMADPIQKGWLVPAGLAWGLALGSRYNLLISVVVYMTVALIQITREVDGEPARKKALLLLVPLIFCVLGLGVYNFSRFGNPLETGFRYQLSTAVAPDGDYSLSNLPSNLYVYFFFPMRRATSFPFILSTLPPGSKFDEITSGLFYSTPGVWLLGLAGPLFVLKRMQRHAPRESLPSGPLRSLSWMIGAGGMGQFLLLMVYSFCAMRFTGDFYLPLILSLAILVWELDGLLQSRRFFRLVMWSVVCGLILWTVGIGFFGAFDIPPQIFRLSNPALFDRLAEGWNQWYAGFTTFFWNSIFQMV